MSYSFSFTQFPTKEFYAFWNAFLEGNFTQDIDQRITILAEKKKEREAVKKFPQGTWENNKDEWIFQRKNDEMIARNASDIRDWENLKKLFKKNLTTIKTAKKDAEKKRAVKESLEEFVTLFGKQNYYEPRILLVDTCETYSDSAKSNAYFFLRDLFLAVHQKDIDERKTQPTLEQWRELYRVLQPDLFEKIFISLCEQHHLFGEAQERTRKECLELLFTLKDLIKICIKKEWDLWFESEFQETDIEAMEKKKLLKKCLEIYETKYKKEQYHA